MKGKKLIKTRELKVTYRPIHHMAQGLETLIRLLGAGLTKGEGSGAQTLKIIPESKEDRK
jgi:hypothetical protein